MILRAIGTAMLDVLEMDRAVSDRNSASAAIGPVDDLEHIDTSSGALGAAVNKALDALIPIADAVQYAETSRGLNQSDSVIDQACEEILISSGLHKEAYQCYRLGAAVSNSYIAWFRAVAKRYPMKGKSQILSDLIATTQGEEGKWFTTAKEIKLFDLALELANRSQCDPKTLKRATRDCLDSEPAFALGSAMAALCCLSEGWGYEVTSVDVVEFYDRAMDAANKVVSHFFPVKMSQISGRDV